MIIPGQDGGRNTSEPAVENDPTEGLGFEIQPTEGAWSFSPLYYPDSFTQNKPKELNRNGQQCSGENVSIKALKNREFHASGVMLFETISTYHELMDHHGYVEILSPLVPGGGMECVIKKAELGDKNGWDPHNRQWLFEYTVDLVSTGRDEFGSNRNAIVTAISN